jgi:hypothetical protein
MDFDGILVPAGTAFTHMFFCPMGFYLGFSKSANDPMICRIENATILLAPNEHGHDLRARRVR